MSVDRLLTRSTAGELYVRALASSYRAGFRVWDPDYASYEDPDAWEKCKRDTVIQAAVDYRKRLVAGRTYSVVPASQDDGPDEMLACVLDCMIKQIDDLPGALYNLCEAIFRGSRYALVEGRMRVLDLAETGPRPWWIPVRLRDVPKERVRFVTDPAPPRLGEIRVYPEVYSPARYAWERLSPSTPLIRLAYDDAEESLGYGRGLLEAIYHYAWAKTQLRQYGLDGAETWAKGILAAQIDGLRLGSADSSNTQVLSRFVDMIEQVRSRHAIAMGKDDELKLLQGGGEGHQIVTALIDYHDKALNTLILGSNLPTSADKGGSYAMAEVQANSTEQLVQFDRTKLDGALTRYLLRYLIRANRPALAEIGLADAASPTFETTQERREDPDKAVDQLVKLRRDAQVPVLIEEAYRKVGWTPPRPGEPTLEPLEPAAAPGFGADVGGGEGDGAGPGDNGRRENKDRDDEANKELRREVSELRTLVLHGQNTEAAHLAAGYSPRARAAGSEGETEEEPDVTKEEAAQLFREALGPVHAELARASAEQAREREQFRVELAELRTRVLLQAQAAPPAAPAACAPPGLQVHVQRAEIAPSTGEMKVFTQDLNGAKVELAAEDRALQADTARALREMGSAVARLADRPEPTPAPMPTILVQPQIELKAELTVPPRRTVIELPDGRKATSTTEDIKQ